MPVSDQFYQEVLENVRSYNSRLCSERRQRLPFLDSQTGIAQSHCNLMVPYRYRGPGLRFGQLYTYPSRRWKKKCTLSLPDLPLCTLNRIKLQEMEGADGSGSGCLLPSVLDGKSLNPSAVISSMNNEGECGGKDSGLMNDDSCSANQQASIMDWDDQSDLPDNGDNDRQNSDSSDYEETYVKRRGKKSGGRGDRGKGAALKDPTFRGPKTSKGMTSGKGRSRKEKDADSSVSDKDKPYACEICPMRYKTRPGLSYHMSHSHNKIVPPEEDDLPITYHQAPRPHPLPPTIDLKTSRGVTTTANKKPPAPSSSSMASIQSQFSLPMAPTPLLAKQGSKYCDFCLGDENENKKTGLREEMVSCADCGRSGHPSCLQFSSNMIISVKKYPWQCIECKSCGLCGTSDNDDQLLFCDDCDRGYHMYCLKPPLSEPPEGSWSCHLCIVEFYSGHKSDKVAS